MKLNKLGSILLYAAALVGLTSALGHMLGSIPAVQEHFGVVSQDYWSNRLTANLYLASYGLFFSFLIALYGAYLASSMDKEKAGIGKMLLIFSILPNLASIFALFTLTPEDWAHAMIHIIKIVLILLGLWLIAKKEPTEAKE